MAQEDSQGIYFSELSPIVRAAESINSELCTALAAVCSEVGYVPESGGKGLPYKFLSEKEIVPAVRDAMHKHGITIIPVGAEPISDKQIGKMTTKTFRITFRICHSSGGHMLAQTLGEGFDSGDKTVYKVMTGAYKYMLRQTFALSGGEDPDDTPSPRGEEHPPQFKQPPKKAPSTPAEIKAWFLDQIDKNNFATGIDKLEISAKQKLTGDYLSDVLARVASRRKALGFLDPNDMPPEGDDPDMIF